MVYNESMKLKQLSKKELINNIDQFVCISKICWEEIGEDPWLENNLKSDYQGKWEYSNYFINEQTILAFLIGTVPENCHGKPREDQGRIGYINKLAVLPEHRGDKLSIENKSIAELLVEDFLLRCKKEGLREARLSVLQNNNRAISFWGKMGFSILEERLNGKRKKMFLMSFDL